MKILMLIDGMRIGGAETHVKTLIAELLRRGEEITLVSSGGAYCDTLSTLGARCITAPLHKRDPISILRSYRIIKREMKSHEIIHAHTRLTAYLAVLARGKRSTPRIVTTAHLNFSKNGIGRLTKWGDITLSVSEDISKWLAKEYGVPNENIIPTVNGIDLLAFAGFLGEEKRILHVSRIDKGRARAAFSLIELAPRLAKDYPDYRIDIVGSGDLFDELSKKSIAANSLIGREYVRLLGERYDISDILSGGGIFVGVSRAALEAMAIGLPTIIAGNEGYGGIICKENLADLVKTNLCARDFPKLNDEKLYSDIVSLIQNEETRGECAKLGRNLTACEYSSDRMASDALSAYIKAKAPRAVLLGYFGFGNLGDEVTLEVCLDELKTRHIKPIAILGKGEKDEGSIYISRYAPIKTCAALRVADMLLLCGGNLIQNETSLKSLVFYSAVIAHAKRLGLKVYFLGSGLGAISGRFATWLASRAISSADFLGARTRQDAELMQSLGGSDVRIMPDLCFLKKVSRSRAGSKHFLIISKSGRYLESGIANEIGTRLGLRPIVTVIFKNEDEERTKRLCCEGEIEFRQSKTEDELRALIESSAFVISERLHGAVFSLLCEKYCYLDSSSSKNIALVNDISQRCSALGIPSPISLILPNEQEKIKEAEAKRFDLRGLISDMRAEISSMLDEIFL